MGLSLPLLSIGNNLMFIVLEIIKATVLPIVCCCFLFQLPRLGVIFSQVAGLFLAGGTFILFGYVNEHADTLTIRLRGILKHDGFVLMLLWQAVSIRWTGLRTGLGDCTHRKLHSSDFEAAHTLLHYRTLTSRKLNSGLTAITRYQYRQDQTKFHQPFLPMCVLYKYVYLQSK